MGTEAVDKWAILMEQSRREFCMFLGDPAEVSMPHGSNHNSTLLGHPLFLPLLSPETSEMLPGTTSPIH